MKATGKTVFSKEKVDLLDINKMRRELLCLMVAGKITVLNSKEKLQLMID